MGVIEVEKLLEQITPEAPCGEDIEYDQAFLELAGLVQPSQAGLVGPEEEVEEPNWREVAQRCSELLSRSKHLRVIIYLTLAAIKLDGVGGLADGLAVLRGVLESYWEHVYPQLDPEDNNDPSERVNILLALSPPPESLQDPLAFIRPVQSAPLCEARQLGRYSMRDIMIAQGQVPAPSEGESVDMGIINGAFSETPIEQLQGTFQALQRALGHVDAIETTLTGRIGAAQAIDLGGLRGLLKQMAAHVQEHLGYEPGEQAAAGAAGADQGALTGEIRSREDVRRVLDKVCQYYEHHEPSSPIPMLLRRARRLVSKDFVQIIQDMTPDAMGQIELIGGIDREGPEQ
ncbi:MAG: hypothetical protein AMJ79_05170 [Phycisphaerae bacterium SM23_30]|nr:MAG: hypothetical protein AMJ79_05170 [Phycisphaerae bacterium SM23_30]